MLQHEERERLNRLKQPFIHRSVHPAPRPNIQTSVWGFPEKIWRFYSFCKMKSEHGQEDVNAEFDWAERSSSRPWWFDLLLHGFIKFCPSHPRFYFSACVSVLWTHGSFQPCSGFSSVIHTFYRVFPEVTRGSELILSRENISLTGRLSLLQIRDLFSDRRFKVKG